MIPPESKEWSILILSRYAELGASSRLRTFQYIPYLEAQGAAVEVAPFFDDDYLESFYATGNRQPGHVLRAYLRRWRAMASARRASVVWVEKEIFPFLPAVFEGILARAGIPYVVDYDDAAFHTYDRSRHAVVRRLLGNKLDPLLRGAYAVTAGNAYLEDYARAHGARNILRVPTVIKLARYPVCPPPESDEIRIGWIGTPVTAKYLDVLRAPLARLAQSRRIRLVTVGAGPIGEFGIAVEQHAWSEASEAELIASMHIGTMPLPDEPWERGKCGYKLIQYMACGRPVIASPVGVNAEIVRPGENGFLAASEKEWLEAFTRLIEDRTLRQIMGANGRKLVETTYSLQAQSPRVTGLLKEAAGRRCAE